MGFDGRRADELVGLAHARIAVGDRLAQALENLRDNRRGDQVREDARLAVLAWDRISAQIPEDVGRMAHEVAIAHLAACWEFYDAHEDMTTAEQGPASEPFCGCQECEVREILYAAWPIFVGGGG